jgi:hypothetical protein
MALVALVPVNLNAEVAMARIIGKILLHGMVGQHIDVA